ncbi:hypothetical protein D3C75_1143450 [compost metagenome]
MYSPNRPMPTNCAPININSTANSMKTPSAAHCGPKARRNTTSNTESAKPNTAMMLPNTLSMRSGVVVRQVTRSYIKLIRRIKLYFDSPNSRSA